MSQGGYFNRAARRSGGYAATRITGAPTKQLLALSVQCFEGRHGDCEGHCWPFGSKDEKCECECHEARRTERPVT